MRGLMIGRFQPFHLGHLELVKQILNECDEVIIALTGSQFNYIKKDPFTSGERIEMIHQTLMENKINLNQSYVIPIENQFNVSLWASYLKSSLPQFDKIYSGNNYVVMLLADFGYTVVAPKFLDREKYNATKIRQMIANNGEWEKLVPSSVSKIIKNVKGENRIKTIFKTDTNPQEY